MESARAKNDIKIKKHVYPALECKSFRSSDEKYGRFLNTDVLEVTESQLHRKFFCERVLFLYRTCIQGSVGYRIAIFIKPQLDPQLISRSTNHETIKTKTNDIVG